MRQVRSSRQPIERLLLLFMGLVLAVAVGASSNPNPYPPSIEIGDLSQTYLRAPVEFTIQEVSADLANVREQAFMPLEADQINQGMSDRAFWVRARLKNSSEQPVTWVLSHETSYIDYLVVHYRDQNDAQFSLSQLSDREAFDQRPVDYRKLAFRHTTAADSYTDLYLKLYFEKADSISLNLLLQAESEFVDQRQQENLLFGVYYGVLLTLAVIALVVSIMLGRLSALYYCLLLVATGTKWLLFNGYGFQYLWPENVFWQNEGFHIVFLLFAILALQFSKAFLKLNWHFPLLSKVFTALQLFSWLAIGLRFAGLYGLVLNVAFVMLFLLAVLVPLASWLTWRKGYQYARWYTLAWLVYSASLILALASAYFSWAGWGMRPLIILQLGSLLEAALLMIAMAEALLGLEEERRQALDMAHRDPLTGLGNRRLLQIEYERFKRLYQKDQKPVFLIMTDLDYFKVINDTYGHDAGDEVLKEVAELLTSHCRETDVCVRYGGEEFAILLRADTLQEVVEVAERIRAEFARSPTHYRNQTIEHTLSSGITPVLDAKERLTVNEMMQRADAALYRGKEAGRNRNIIYGKSSDADR